MSEPTQFRPQDVNVYRPYPDEIPWDLLLAADSDEERVYGYAEADYMRVAKYRDVAIGVYVVRVLEPPPGLDPIRFELCNLSVALPYRHKGLGRWLLGHAIGISESKGAREILLTGTPLRGLFQRAGFISTGADLLLLLTPE